MMGGSILVESEVGRGSTFHFTLGFRTGEERAGQSAGDQLERLRGLRVLVVDDNATNRRMLERTLSSWQAAPVAVDGGPLALAEMERAIASGEPYDLVVLDSMMPDMDGFELARRIKSRPDLAGATLLMVASGERPGDAQIADVFGVSSYLTKPVRQSKLLHSINAALDGQSPGGERSREPTGRLEGISARSLRVLLAEDNAVNRKLAARVLEKRGHTVVLAQDGLEAVAAFKKDHFDVVLMDVQMPRMDGFEATAAVRRHEEATGSHVPVIAMTAKAMKGDRERCLEAGMDDYISKPVEMRELVRTVEGSVSEPLATDASPAQEPDGSVDRAQVLSRLGGDHELLREISSLFLSDCPTHLDDIGRAITAGDGNGVESAAMPSRERSQSSPRAGPLRPRLS